MGNNDKTKKQLIEERDTTPHLGEQSTAVPAQGRSTPLRFLVVVTLSIFAAGAFHMPLLSLLSPLPILVEVLVHGLLLTVLVLPILYLFLFRPLLSSITELKQAETGLKKAHDKLEIMGQESPFDPTKAYEYMERRVQERTLELKKAYEYMEHRLKQRSNEMEVLYQQLRTQVRERRNLLGRIITAQEEERRRIARELHDEVSQTLTGLVMSLGSTEALAGLSPAAKQRLESLRNLTSEAVEEVRRLIRDLRPSLLDDLGLVAAISWYVENYLATAGVKAELDTHGLDRRLPPTVEITLFRVVQEAITNIVKHAQAKTARIYLKRTGSTIVGSIEDSGVGFDADTIRREQSSGTAVGLLGMEERINLLEGKLKIESRPGGGTRVYFEIPWQESGSEKNSHSYS